MSARKLHPRKLHLGCGLVQPEGWINLDGSWNAWLAKHPVLRAMVGTMGLVPRNQLEVAWGRDTLVHDVRRPLPFANGSITAIYSSHLLEHLYVDEATRLLAECHRVLVPEGVLRVVVPDLRAIVEEYMGGDPLDPLPHTAPLTSPADRMIRRLLLRTPTAPAGWGLYRAYTSSTDFHGHKWMYDSESLIARFRAAGFEDVAQREFNDSRIDDLASVEQACRIVDGRGLCVEGLKCSRIGRVRSDRDSIVAVGADRAD
jgi:SAM-dependent methyltransferase